MMKTPDFNYPLKDNQYETGDGDSVTVVLDRGWNETKKTSMRLLGLDAPETRTLDSFHKSVGYLVSELTDRWLKVRVAAGLQLYASSEERPKWANRTLGRIWAGDLNDCLNDYLLEAGLAKPYAGGKRSWTEEELREIEKNAQALL